MVPAVIDQPSTTHIEQLHEQIEQLEYKASIIRSSEYKVDSPQGFEELENTLMSIYREISDLSSAVKIQQLLDQEASKADALELAKSIDKKVTNEGKRYVTIRFANGTKIPLIVTYYTTTHKKKRNRRDYIQLYSY